MAEIKYTEDHEYAHLDGDVAAIGITKHAQEQLGDVVFVELPEAGSSFSRMEVFGTIEAVKAVSDLYCPVDGTVVEVNAALDDDPSLVNSDPYGEGWMIKLRVEDDEEVRGLLTSDGYADHVG